MSKNFIIASIATPVFCVILAFILKKFFPEKRKQSQKQEQSFSGTGDIKQSQEQNQE